MRPHPFPLPNKNQRNSLQNPGCNFRVQNNFDAPYITTLSNVRWMSFKSRASKSEILDKISSTSSGRVALKKLPVRQFPLILFGFWKKQMLFFVAGCDTLKSFNRSYWFGICINLYLLRRCFFVFIYRYVSGEQVIPSQELFGWEVILFHDYCLYLIGKVYNKRYPTLRVCVQCVQMMHVIFFWLDGVH